MATSPQINISSIKPFCFKSYGVSIKIDGGDQTIIDEASLTARTALLDNLELIKAKRFNRVFDIQRSKTGTLRLIQDGVELAKSRNKKKFLHFFDAIVRVAVGELSTEYLFMHAGVVGWKGKAIILPADSFQGKTTLVAELVRQGAEYYSDEFAVIDPQGIVHPFARELTMRRTVNGSISEYNVPVSSLNGIAGTKPLAVSAVILTGYKPHARWSPEILTPGVGMLKMIPFTLSAHRSTDFAMGVLNKVVSRAIIASSLRGNAKNLAKTLLDFVDKRAN